MSEAKKTRNYADVIRRRLANDPELALRVEVERLTAECDQLRAVAGEMADDYERLAFPEYEPDVKAFRTNILLDVRAAIAADTQPARES